MVGLNLTVRRSCQISGTIPPCPQKHGLWGATIWDPVKTGIRTPGGEIRNHEIHKTHEKESGGVAATEGTRLEHGFSFPCSIHVSSVAQFFFPLLRD
jgi:hypothetical protein